MRGDKGRDQARRRGIACGGDPIAVDVSRAAVLRLVARGKRVMSDYYDYKYLLYKEIYENGSVSQ